MSHNIKYETYHEKVNKKSVQAEWDAYVRHADWEEGASGLPNQIRWIDTTLPDYDSAMSYIEQHDKKWYDQLAVKYIEYSGAKPTKKEETLKEKVGEACKKYNSLSNEFYFAGSKSAFKSCPKCNSKLSLSYLNSNICPLCYSDLRPSSAIIAIDKAKTNWKELQKAYDEERKKNEKKGKKSVKWLVKIEYHT